MPGNESVSPAKWTVMIYMAANDTTSNRASKIFRKELNEIGKKLDAAAAPAEVNILLQAYLDWDTSGKETNYRVKRYKICEDFENKEPLDVLDSNISMGKAETLSSFIKWCRKEYPAEKYLLLLWGHGTGSGMFQAELEEAHQQAIQHNPGFSMTLAESGQAITIQDLMKDDSVLFDNPDKEAKIKINYTDAENKIVSDTITASKKLMKSFKDKPKYYLSAGNNGTINFLRRYIVSTPNLDGLIGKELNKSLENSFGAGEKIDLVAILGCCMQMVEFGYEIREQCRYYVASEELIFFEGYNYTATFSGLVDNPGISARELGKKMILDTGEKEGYSAEEKKYLAISCVDLQKSGPVARALNSIAEKILTAPEDLRDQVRHSREECSHFGERSYMSSFIDVSWYLKRLSHNISGYENFSELRQEIDELIRYLQQEYIVQAYIGENKQPRPEQLRSLGGHGLAIYFPDTQQDHEDDEERGKYFNRNETEYVNSFSAGNKWNEMIFDYIREAVT